MEFLPEEDRAEFASEFMRTLKGSDEIDRLDLVGTLIRQWKNTAEFWADPELRRRLAAPEPGGEEIPHPWLMSKRGSKVERPIAKGEWTPKFDNNAAAKAWRD